MSDYTPTHADARAEFALLFVGRRYTGRRRTPGVNFMTPDVLGVVTDPTGTPVEVSTGVFLDQRIYGVTWPRRADGTPDPRDTSCGSLTEAFALIYGDRP